MARPDDPWIIAVTGASGTPYARALIRLMLAAGERVDLIVSRAARLTLLDETGINWNDGPDRLVEWIGADVPADMVTIWSATDFAAGPSSGSYPTRGMVVVPATAGAIAGIALGLSKDLVQRAAMVTRKERRRLILVPRELPLTATTLHQLAELADDGVIVAPASPGFYSGWRSIDDLVVFVAGRIADLMGIPSSAYARWSGLLGQQLKPQPGK